MKNGSKYTKAAVTLLSANLLFACSNETITEVSTDTANESGTTADNAVAVEEVTALAGEAVSYNEEDLYTDWETEAPVAIELNGDTAAFDSTAAVLFEDNTLTIKAGGTYVLSGSLNGQVIVESENKNTVRLVLNGVEIHSAETSAIHIANAEKAVISLAEGTENSVSDGKTYVFDDAEEDEPNAAIFSKSDLTINGTGRLTVAGNYNNGIASKDELKIMSGTIDINAVDDGLQGRDIVAVKEGTITIVSGGDGIKSSNDEDAEKGGIVLGGGTVDITSGGDGIQAVTSLWITGGDYTIASGGGSPETIEVTQERGMGQSESVTTASEETEDESTKGLKAGTAIQVAGGTFDIDSLDDAVHSNGSVTIGGGDWTIATGDDGIHADAEVTTTGGTINITKSNEGLEGATVMIEDGIIQLVSADDGINASGGTATTGEVLVFNGGYVSVNASGDGLDANGSALMTGGTVLVNGPTDSGNGSLDYDGSFDVTGGLLIAAGSAGMVQAISEESTQSSMVMMYPETQEAGTIVYLEDGEGNPVATFAPEKDYQAVLISAPELIADSVYTLYAGGTSTGTATAGLYADGTYEGGTEVVSFTIAEATTWLDETGVTEAASGGFGGPAEGGAGRPERAGMGGILDGLDAETQEKVQAIMEQERAGTITQEEARAQLAELGVEMPQMSQ